MIKKIINCFKKITFISAVLAITLNIAVYSALAAAAPDPTPTANPSSDIERGQQMMNQMMGGNFSSTNDFMDQMMGSNGAQSMYELMGKFSAAGLSANDTKPLSDFMNACRTRSNYNYDSSNSGGMMGNWNWDSMMGTGLGIGGLFLVLGGVIMIIFWVIVILAAVALLRWLINYLKGNTGASSKAMDILKEKYAKGEITKEELESKKKDIM